MDDPTRAQRTHDKAMHGHLPAQNGAKLWAGKGEGGACDGCGECISKIDQEYELVFSDVLTLRFHGECFRAWSAVLVTAS
jgi:hypothetical protein